MAATRLSFEKGTDVLLEIGKRLPSDTHLMVLGDGPEKQKFVELDEAYENVHYLGYQDKNSVIQLIRGSDVLIQPTLGQGVSSTLLEAMLCETAVVTSDIVSNREWLKNGVDAILVGQTDHAGFIEQINVVLNDKELQASLKKRGLAAARKYNWDMVGDKYQKIYESLLK